MLSARSSRPLARRRHADSILHFSFNLPGGRCEVCQGDGTVTVEMQFLADVELVCEECKGTRFKQQILDVRYRGKNIHEVLSLTVREAINFFREVPRITNRLRVLDEVGLGYLRLGSATTCPAVRPSALNSRRISQSAPAPRRSIFSMSRRRVFISMTSTNCWLRFVR